MRKRICMCVLVLLLAGCTPTITVRSSVEPVKPGNSRSSDMSVVKLENVTFDTIGSSVFVKGTLQNVSNHQVCSLRVEFEILDANGRFLTTAYDYANNGACIPAGARAAYDLAAGEISGARKVHLLSAQWRPMSVD